MAPPPLSHLINLLLIGVLVQQSLLFIPISASNVSSLTLFYLYNNITLLLQNALLLILLRFLQAYIVYMGKNKAHEEMEMQDVRDLHHGILSTALGRFSSLTPQKPFIF